MDSIQSAAGPSRPPTASSSAHLPPKPAAAYPNPTRPIKRKRPPRLPAAPIEASRPGGTTATHPHLPIKVLQGASTRRTDSTRAGFGREVLFVTRKIKLGVLLGKCRSLVVDEGYTHLRLHSLGAAIPHALLLLHAVLDILPYPRGPRGLWYEIRTGTEKCTDDVEAGSASTAGRPQRKTGKKGNKQIQGGNSGEGGDRGLREKDMDVDMADEIVEPVSSAVAAENGGDAAVHSWLEGIGSMVALAPITQIRMTSSIQIDIYVGPKARPVPAGPAKESKHSKPGEGRARPNKKRRTALLAQRKSKRAVAGQPDGGEAANEEDMMNEDVDAADDEEEEPIEELEMR